MSADFQKILGVLRAHEVEFVVVGALAAVLQGAPIMTLDVDVVHRRTPENIDRLIAALRELDAHFRGHGERKLVPQVSHLESRGHQLLTTQNGALDVLGAIEDGLDYDALIDESVGVEIEGEVLRVLSLARYVALKERSDRPKDQARLPVLRQTLREHGE